MTYFDGSLLNQADLAMHPQKNRPLCLAFNCFARNLHRCYSWHCGRGLGYRHRLGASEACMSSVRWSYMASGASTL